MMSGDGWVCVRVKGNLKTNGQAETKSESNQVDTIANVKVRQDSKARRGGVRVT